MLCYCCTAKWFSYAYTYVYIHSFSYSFHHISIKKNKIILSKIKLPPNRIKLHKKEESHISPDDVVGITHNIPSQPKISDLRHFPVGHQDIPGCQVSVKTLERTRWECDLPGCMFSQRTIFPIVSSSVGVTEGFADGSDGKESACNARAAGDVGSIHGLGRSPGGGNGNPLQYSCLENPMDRGAWWAAVHGVAKSRTRLSN